MIFRLVSSFRFIWIPMFSYGSTAIRNIITLTLRWSPLDVTIWHVYRRQIRTTKVDPRAVRLTYPKRLAVNVYQRIGNIFHTLVR